MYRQTDSQTHTNIDKHPPTYTHTHTHMHTNAHTMHTTRGKATSTDIPQIHTHLYIYPHTLSWKQN